MSILGEVLIIWLVRGHGETTPVAEPPDLDPQWQQMELLAAICHSGSASSGHWQAFCRQLVIWWSIIPGQNTTDFYACTIYIIVYNTYIYGTACTANHLNRK